MKVVIMKDNVSEDTNKPRALGYYTYPNSDKPHQSSTFYDKNAVSPTLDTCGGGNTQVKILVENNIDPININVIGNYTPSGHDASRIVHPGGVAPTVKENHGTVTATIDKKWISTKGVKYITDPKRGLCTDINADISQTITAVGQSNWTGSFVSPDIDHLEKSTTIGSTEPTRIHLKDGSVVTSNDDLSKYRIRKLTPKECWRLMGFDDVDFEKAEKVCSNTQLYKQAGNSIVVNVLEGILSALLPKQSRSEWLDELLGV